MRLDDVPAAVADEAVPGAGPRIVQLVQGSAEWLAYRRSVRNASESAALLGLSPWMTPYQLWRVKTGRFEPPVTQAMQRGTELEPLARQAYEAQTGLHQRGPVPWDTGGTVHRKSAPKSTTLDNAETALNCCHRCDCLLPSVVVYRPGTDC